MSNKVCTVCNLNLPHEFFYPRKDGRAKLQSLCRACHSKARRAAQLKRYGLTKNDYDLMMRAQEGRCLLCRSPASDEPRSLCVDHDHSTGRVRGLLCVTCNRALGLLKDDPELMRRAADYVANGRA